MLTPNMIVNQWSDSETSLQTGEYHLDYQEHLGKWYYTALICREGQSIGPRGGKKPATMVEIFSPTWHGLRAEFRSLGLPSPPLEEGTSLKVR